ncbi:DapH/DapD/GlmU-related protein [Caldibacillus thermoamylovorans]|uniref:acyltransferase n=1 Tax=Caldibacillus thermoamylovorans TaxID=35841 RepID=UPI002559B5D4|nr:acyltransferase [Caldibacillus thermoamylovorans]
MKLSYIIKKVRFYLIFSAFKRGEYLRKKRLLNDIGENIFFQPRKLPGDPQLLRFKNNIAIASGVVFVNHDVMHHVFNNIENGSTEYHMGCTEVGNNVFIGSNTIILPNIKIGDNCIIAAGSVVTKDIPEGSVVAGTPANIIEDFEKIFKQRKREYQANQGKTREQIISELWKEFDNGSKRKTMKKRNASS